MLLRHESVNSATEVTLVFFQILLRLRHLVAVRFFLGKLPRPSQLLVLLFQLRLKELIFNLFLLLHGWRPFWVTLVTISTVAQS